MQELPLLDTGGVWHITYFIGLEIIILFFLNQSLGNNLPLVAKILWAYLLAQALFIIEWPSAHFGVYTPNFQSTAGQVFIEALFIPIAAIQMHKVILKVIPLLALFSTVCVWFKWPGLMHAPSFNMALAAMCIPVIPFPMLNIFIVATALTHHGSTALLIIGAQAIALVLKGKIKWSWIVPGFCGLLVSAYLLQNQPMFNSGERMQKWAEYMFFWMENLKRMSVGSGPGSFIWYSIMTHKYRTGFYLQMHSEPLQILWENGIAGLLLALGTCYVAVKSAWAHQGVTSLQCILGCIAFAMTYEPLRYFPSALLTAVFFARVLVVKNIDV